MEYKDRLSSTLMRFLEEEYVENEIGKSEKLRQIINIIEKQNSIETIDIWHDKDYAISHWVLLINGINQASDLKLSSNLLTWKEFSSKETASVQCIQASDHKEFNYCSSIFSVDIFPALIIGDSPTIKNYLVIGNELLTKLAEDDAKLQSMFQKIHLHLINGGDFDKLKTEMKSDIFWKNMKLIYSEVKGFFSINIQEKSDIL